jgi:hypothetical protein
MSCQSQGIISNMQSLRHQHYERQLSGRLHSLVALSNHLLDFFILVLKQPEGISHVVPLSFTFCSRQPRCELVRELLSMFIL